MFLVGVASLTRFFFLWWLSRGRPLVRGGFEDSLGHPRAPCEATQLCMNGCIVCIVHIHGHVLLICRRHHVCHRVNARPKPSELHVSPVMDDDNKTTRRRRTALRIGMDGPSLQASFVHDDNNDDDDIDSTTRRFEGGSVSWECVT